MATCYRCMRGELVHGYCKFCGRSQDASLPSDKKLVLKPGTMLQGGAVTVGALLGQGGFGATYIARTSQDGVIALKEYLPGTLVESERYGNSLRMLRGKEALFEYNMTAFQKEAELLSKLAHPNIIQVKMRFWENNTAYYGMDLLEGSDLLTFIRARKGMTLRAAEAANLIERLYPVLDALAYLHRRKILHRDVSPSNIYLRGWNLDKNSFSFNPCLIDFGAAYVAHTDYHKSLAKVKNPHYSPYEQSTSEKNLSPASDVYALCATLYHMLTGIAPQMAVDRMTDKDELKQPSAINPALRPLDDILMRGMAQHVQDRVQSIDELKAGLDEAIFMLRGGKKSNITKEIDYDRDPVLKSVLALVFDTVLPVSLTLLPIVLGGLEWWMMALSFLWMYIMCLLFLLIADGTLGMLVFHVPRRGGGFGKKALSALLRSILPYAAVDMILFGCEVYSVPKCNGRPRSGRGQVFIPPPPPPPIAEFRLISNYAGPDGKPVSYPLYDRKVVHIGRAVDNEIVVPDQQGIVSNHHMEVVCQDGVVCLKDISTNGCYVRKHRLEKGRMYSWTEGEWVVIGRNIGFRMQRY